MASACGYRPLGHGAAFGARSICVVPFAEPDAAGITASLAQHLGLALAAEGFVVVADPEAADAVLTGDIQVRHLPGATLRAVQVYTVDVGVNAALWGADNTLLWQNHSAAGRWPWSEWPRARPSGSWLGCAWTPPVCRP